jgi:cytidylate kinase
MEHVLQNRLGGYLLSHRTRQGVQGLKTGWSVTISREAGAGGSSVARLLADYFEKRSPNHENWTVFDHDLVQKALEQHRLPKDFERFIPEDATRRLSDTVEDLLGLHPASSELVRRVSETMLNLARNGNVILVGRGGNVITSRLPNVFHVRLVGSRASRLKNIRRQGDFSTVAAEEFLIKMDRARKRYLRQNFDAQIDDPLSYDLIINTGRVGFEEATMLIGEAVLGRMPHDDVDDLQGGEVRS